MKKIMFAGHGDDVVYVRADREPGHEYKVDSELTPAAVFMLEYEGEVMLVFAHYDDGGCWYFGVGRLSEGIPLPPWRIAVGTEDKLWSDYTAVFVVEVPDGATVMRFDQEELPDSEEIEREAAMEPADALHLNTV